MPFSLILPGFCSDLIKLNILGKYMSSMYESRVFVLSRNMKCKVCAFKAQIIMCFQRTRMWAQDRYLMVKLDFAKYL